MRHFALSLGSVVLGGTIGCQGLNTSGKPLDDLADSRSEPAVGTFALTSCATDLVQEASLSSSGNWIGGDPTLASDNPCGIQGSIYALSDAGIDGIVGTVDDALRSPPFDALTGERHSPCSQGRCCISGFTTLLPENGEITWGAELGIRLNDPGDGSPPKPYVGDAVGFKIELSGALRGHLARIGFTQSASDFTYPFFSSSRLGKWLVKFMDASCPDWEYPNCHDPSLNPYDLRIRVEGGFREGPYELCVDSISPMTLCTDANSPTGPQETGADDKGRCVDPTCIWSQEYLNAAAMGIGHLTMSGAPLTVAGALGDGIQFGDLEEGWDLSHPNMPQPVDPAVFPDAGVKKDINPGHGRAVVGIVNAKFTGGCGYRSIAPNAKTRYYSAWVKSPIIPKLNVSKAILNAIGSPRRLQYGDTLLIGLQGTKTLPSGLTVNAPVEVAPDVRDMLRLATTYGVVVVESAGTNAIGSAQNIDGWLSDTRTGALIVGAANGYHATLPESNYGSRVDFFAWGTEDLSVLGKDGLFELTGRPSTDWSAAIIAGVAVSVQGMVKASSNDPDYRIGPAAMRELLRTTGATAGWDSSLPVGVMPNLEAISARIGAIPDSYIRDDYADIGSPRPTTGTLSPDITIRQAIMSVEQQEDTFNNYSETPSSGEPPILYARVHNHGPARSPEGDLVDPTVTFYYASTASPLPTPNNWVKICSMSIAGRILPGSSAINHVTSPTELPTHGVIIAVSSAHFDESPWFEGLNIGDWPYAIRQNNNFAMRAY